MEVEHGTPPFVLGLDVGTQSLRAALVDWHGRTVAYGAAPIETSYPRPTWAEQQPLAWWSAARQAVRLALAQGNARPEQVAAVGLDCTACTVVACDQQAGPLRPALLWMDQRTFREADEISATGEPILRYVSGRVSPEWMLPKALWLKRHEPEIYDQADRIVECTDWMMFRLTGEWTLSLNHVAVKWNYARPDGGWPTSLLVGVDLVDLLEKWPPRIVPLGKGEGRLSGPAAGDLGLPAGIPVAQGGIDAYLGMLGLGATQDGDVAVIVGSSTCHLAQSREGVFGSGAAGCYPDATVEGLYTLEAGQTATGSILDWYRRHFAGSQERTAEARGVHVFQVLDEQAAAVAARQRWPGRARRLAGQSLALQEPPGAGRDRRVIAGARSRPYLPGHLRGDRLRHPAHPGRRACATGSKSNESSWAAAAPSRPYGYRSTPTSSRSPCTLRARARLVRWGRRWRRPWPRERIATSTRQPARWSRSKRASSPIRPTPRCMTTCSGGMWSFTGG